MSDSQAPRGGTEQKEGWRLVFFGSDTFSLPSLEMLAQGPDKVSLVVTSPPAPCGRGCKVKPSPVAELATELGIPIFETKSVRSPEAIAHIASFQPDLLVVVAYGGFLPDPLLKMCAHPPLNVHPSLLPRHRGAAPINWCLIQGDQEIGVSIIFLEQEMDAGPILSQSRFCCSGADCASQWSERLAQVGGSDLLKVIANLQAGFGESQPQDESLVTINPLLRKSDGRVDWNCSALVVARLIAGVDPWPGAATTFKGKQLKLFGAQASDQKTEAAPGQILGLDEQGRLLIATGDGGIIMVAEFQPEGKKRLGAAEFMRGYRPELLGCNDK